MHCGVKMIPYKVIEFSKYGKTVLYTTEEERTALELAAMHNAQPVDGNSYHVEVV